MLLDEGTITREQFEAAVRAMGERGLDFGSALTEGRALTASALYVQLRRLVLRRAVATRPDR